MAALWFLSNGFRYRFLRLFMSLVSPMVIQVTVVNILFIVYCFG